ncbi:unnamed protein product, partial [Rotaria sp. Silwood1]
PGDFQILLLLNVLVKHMENGILHKLCPHFSSHKVIIVAMGYNLIENHNLISVMI